MESNTAVCKNPVFKDAAQQLLARTPSGALLPAHGTAAMTVIAANLPELNKEAGCRPFVNAFPNIPTGPNCKVFGRSACCRLASAPLRTVLGAHQQPFQEIVHGWRKVRQSIDLPLIYSQAFAAL